MGRQKNKNGLTDNQQTFVDEYLIDKNGTRAYLAAYPAVKKKEAAEVNASKLLRNTKVKQVVEEGLAAQQKRLEIEADEVLREVARIAFFDIRKLFNDNGAIKAISELDDDAAAAVRSIDVIQPKDAETGVVRKIILWDKMSALDKLCKHFGLTPQKITGGDQPICIQDDSSKELSPAAQALLDDILNGQRG